MFYWKYATESLKRGGQRIFIALMCIAFGVMSLTAMQSLASTIRKLVLVDPRLTIGGDASLTTSDTTFLSEADLAEIEAAYQVGKIEHYSPISYTSTQLIRINGSARAYFINDVYGIDPARYPLVGRLELQGEKSLAELLQQTGDAVITRDLAEKLKIEIGDQLVMGGRNSSTPIILTVRGIAQATPNGVGQTIFFNLATAQALWDREEIITEVLALWGDDSGEAEFSEQGWFVITAEIQQESNERMAKLFNFWLNGAGILGLLVGGIGVANTMQVLLTHRRKEIAMLKTLGYQPRDLGLLFGIEMLLLGVVGSLIGSVAAIGISRGLYEPIERSSNLLFNWQFEPAALISGLLVGIVTTVLFGLYAIWRASAVPPAMLFRELPVQHNWKSWLQVIGFYLVLAIPFSVVTSLIFRSVLQGIGILLLSAAGLIVLGLTLGGIIWVTLRIIPAVNRFRMAKSNIQRRWLSTLFAMIALFIGVFSLGFAVTVIDAARNEQESRSLSTAGTNLAIFTDVGDEAALRNYLPDGEVRYETDALRIEDSAGNPLTFYQPNMVQGRLQPWDIEIVAGTWGAEGVYLPESHNLPVGSKITLTMYDNTAITLSIAGIYRPRSVDSLLFNSPDAVVMHRDLLNRLNPNQVRLMLATELPVNRLTAESDRIGAAFPQALLINSSDLNSSFISTIHNLYVFAVALAGLALLAGVMLMANAIGLAIVDRQREIGVLKAVGYTRRDILLNVITEYGLLGMIASITGVIGVQIFIVILTGIGMNSGEMLVMSPSIAIGVCIVGVLLTIGTAAAVTWQPTNIRPVTVLARE